MESLRLFLAVLVPAIAVLVPAHVCAADRAEKTERATLPPVTVSALKDPVEKSYRKIVRGMDVFDKRRSLAPGASLRFKLLPRNRDTHMDGIALSVVGDSVHIPIHVAPDSTFTVERSAQALKENALVIPDRKAHTMTWRADIRTPGLPPDTRRLGDLRLECLVGMAADLVSNARSLIDQMLRAITDQGYCARRESHYLFFAERPLWSVTLVHGSRREILPVEQMYAGISRDPMTRADLQYCDCEVLLDRTYYAPLGDASWPDDTLLLFEYMDDPGTNTEVLAVPGEPLVIRFESGYQVRVYRRGQDPGATGRTGRRAERVPAERSSADSEFVVLLAPSGIVAKTRLRPAPGDL